MCSLIQTAQQADSHIQLIRNLPSLKPVSSLLLSQLEHKERVSTLHFCHHRFIPCFASCLQGLRSFLEKFPPPEKVSKAVQEARDALLAVTVSSTPAMVPPPLLMPGMTVKVTNPRDAYYLYSGIVQRITDGRVGVLFEGGNWDKMVAFDQKDLERTTKGPPGTNPKSAVLESMVPAKPVST